MPVRDRAVQWFLDREIGTQVFDGRTGTCLTMDDEEYDKHRGAAEDVWAGLVDVVDWQRVALQATGRHSTVHPDIFEICGACIAAVLLVEDTFPTWTTDQPQGET